MKLTSVIIFTTLLLIVTSRAETCTPILGCDVTINGQCYTHVDDNLNWNQAEACCVAWGGHLASIHSAGVNMLLNDIRNKDRFTWIGLSDTATDGTYVWTDGTPFGYENFHPTQPDSLNGESCFHFFFNEKKGELLWHDYHCDRNTWGNVLTSYICQKGELEFKIAFLCA